MQSQAEFATFAKRKNNEAELEILISEWTANYTADKIENVLQSVRVAANIVAKVSDAYADAQLKHRKYFTRLKHTVIGEPALEPQACYILSKTPREIRMPPPCLGEHNTYVFKQLLGMTDDEIAEHIVDGSITTELSGEVKMNM